MPGTRKMPETPPNTKRWKRTALIYLAFSAGVFALQGSEPALGPDHLTYLQQADSILASCPAGDYWRETTSIRFFGVLLAYLHGWTGSHIGSMKLVLLVFSVLFLLASELFFSLFARSRGQAVAFALISGFAVSFGFASWGVTDSTALLPRTLIAPVIMLSVWFWFRFDGRPVKYLGLIFLALASAMHLSAFYALGVLALLEIWDVAIVRRRLDQMFAAYLGVLVLAVATLVALEYVGLNSKSLSQHVPETLRAMGVPIHNISFLETSTLLGCKAPATASPPPALPANPSSPAAASSPPPVPAGPMTPQQAWAAEIAMRPWRNMPLPLANVANMFSSSALILAVALAGMAAARREGYTRADWLMTGLILIVPAFAFLPQTLLWILRSRYPIYPATIEEVRALGLIMIPCLYFALRLHTLVSAPGSAHAQLKGAAVIAAVVALPLFMKNMPVWTREAILSGMAALRIVDPASESSVANARSALGIAAGSSSLYYGTQGVRGWLAKNTAPGARILTDRDDFVLLRDRVILGPRQVAVNVYKGTQDEASLFLDTSRAMAARDTDAVRRIGAAARADLAVVAWPVAGALYSDRAFSVVPIAEPAAGSRP